MSTLVEQPAPDAARAAAQALAAGRFIVLAEGRHPEAEGNLTIAAEFVSPEVITELSAKAQGVVRLCLTDERCADLGLAATEVSEQNWQPTASIAHRGAIARGASAADQAATILAALDPAQGRDDFVSGGYVFPLRARPDGVLRRAGRTEAAVDLARLAGCTPAAAMSLVMNEDGSVARGAELAAYAERMVVPVVTVADVIALRRLSERLVDRVANARLATRYGEFTAVGFREKFTGEHHVALVKGDIERADDVLVRVHSRCLVGDVFGATLCTCRADMLRALQLIDQEGCGVLLYLFSSEHESWVGDGEPWQHTPGKAAMDEYGIGAQILAELGLGRIRVITDHPRTITGLDGFGLEIVGHVPIGTRG